MKVEMKGSVVNVSAKLDASSNVVKRVVLEVQCELADFQELMQIPLAITFEPLQATFGAGDVPERRGKKPKGDA